MGSGSSRTAPSPPNQSTDLFTGKNWQQRGGPVSTSVPIRHRCQAAGQEWERTAVRYGVSASRPRAFINVLNRYPATTSWRFAVFPIASRRMPSAMVPTQYRLPHLALRVFGQVPRLFELGRQSRQRLSGTTQR